MLPGRFLGIARTIGDHFTFIIFQDLLKTGKVLHRSIIQRTNMNDTRPFTNYSIPSVVPSHEPIELQQNPQIGNQEEVLIPSNDPEEIIIDDDNNNCVIHADYEKDYNIHPNTLV